MIRLTNSIIKAVAIYISYVRPVMAPTSRPSLQHVFIPPKICYYLDLKERDMLMFDDVKKRIVIKILKRDKMIMVVKPKPMDTSTLNYAQQQSILKSEGFEVILAGIGMILALSLRKR